MVGRNSDQLNELWGLCDDAFWHVMCMSVLGLRVTMGKHLDGTFTMVWMESLPTLLALRRQIKKSEAFGLTSTPFFYFFDVVFFSQRFICITTTSFGFSHLLVHFFFYNHNETHELFIGRDANERIFTR